jgi:hypothetical protein
MRPFLWVVYGLAVVMGLLTIVAGSLLGSLLGQYAHIILWRWLGWIK